MQDASKANRNVLVRPMLCAGGAYPKQANVLKRELNRYLAALPNFQPPVSNLSSLRGIISPHIDYARGGAAYAAAWRAMQPAAQQADLAIILGTDHRGTGQLFTLTHQSYATPYGVLPTAQVISQSIAQVIGPQRAYAAEHFHSIEHSIELPLVWLHHMREGAPIEVLPVIVGSFWDEMQRGRSPSTNAQVIAFVSALKNAMRGHSVIVIASGDLSHVGPVFDGPPLSDADKVDLQAYDQTLMQHIVGGDAEGWFAALAETQNATNVCGLAPVCLTLKLIEPSKGHMLSYTVCPADERNTSVVSVCGAVLA